MGAQRPGAARRRQRGPPLPPALGKRAFASGPADSGSSWSRPGHSSVRAQLPKSEQRSQVYLARNSFPRPRASMEYRSRTRSREPGNFSPTPRCAQSLPPPALPNLGGRPRTTGHPEVPRPSPCSEAPSCGGSSSSDLRCWGLACLRRDMLLAALRPRAGQRHQRGGRRGQRGVGAGWPGGRGAQGAGRWRRLRGPRMGLSN